MRSVMRRNLPVAILACVVGVLVVSMASMASMTGLARQGADLTVTVSYTGKGPVDEKNDVLVFLFDHPEPTGESRPLGLQTVTKNGGVATFKGVTTPIVYMIAVYDEQANYDGRSGPPPVGTPESPRTRRAASRCRSIPRKRRRWHSSSATATGGSAARATCYVRTCDVQRANVRRATCGRATCHVRRATCDVLRADVQLVTCYVLRAVRRARSTWQVTSARPHVST